VNVLAELSRQRTLLARAVVPSVVSITTSRSVQNDPLQDPVLQLFHQGVPRGPGSSTQHSLGSGAIVSKEGHIVTNHHVIEGTDQIEVELSDGRRKQAILIGTDMATDIAVLKIEADDLVPLPFGDSDQVEVGETVMAIGNPFGYEESVTQGIISAKGRRGSENLSDLFQTDAAINPGNSGGPLVNVRGEMIGINEAILSQSGGWQGVGFSIPSATVRRTLDSILKTGRVLHGYLGIEQRPLTQQSAAQSGLPETKGVLVENVVIGSPADKANIRPGDVIQKFNNQPVADIIDLRHCVDQVDIAATAKIELLRAGKTVLVEAQIAERPPGALYSRVPTRVR
jgi:Do/DeqQ family serine protease